MVKTLWIWANLATDDDAIGFDSVLDSSNQRLRQARVLQWIKFVSVGTVSLNKYTSFREDFGGYGRNGEDV